MQDLWQDIQLTFRSLGKRPGFSAAAIAILAIALGANSAMFSVVHAVLFQIPAKKPEQLIVMWERDVERDIPMIEVSYANFGDWKEQSSAFDNMAAFGSVNWGQALIGSGEPYHASSAAVSGSFFDTLGVPPILGRTFRREEDEIGAGKVAVLSYGLWQDRFGGDTDIVGETIRLEGDSEGPEPFTVIGVMPREFEFPRGAELWTPVKPRIAFAANKFSLGLDDALRGLGVLFVVGRLKSDVSLSEAEAELNSILRNLGETYGRSPGTIVQTPFPDYYLGGNMRSSVQILWGAVGLVLLIACANVAGLLLVRALANRRALAIRQALGAGRSRIVRHVLLEGAVLGLGGGFVGIALAAGLLPLCIAVAPPDVPGVRAAELHGGVLGVTAGLCIFAGLLSALTPAWRAASVTASSGLRASFATGGCESRWAHGGMVVVEVALALALLIGAGLMARSVRNVHQVNLGYEPERVLTVNVPLPDSRYPTVASKSTFFEELLKRLDRLTDVVSAAGVYLRPLELGAVGMDSGFIAEGQPMERETIDKNPMLNWEAVTPGYFRTMGIRLVEGRVFDSWDSEGATRVAVVGENLARRMWPGESAVGKRIWTQLDRVDESEMPLWRTVVGIVEDARYRELTGTRLDFYVPCGQSSSPVRHLIIRTSGDPLTIVPAVREQVRAVDRNQPIDGIISLKSLVGRATAPWRFTALVLVGFASVALVLALAGLFSVLAYTVRQKIHEIGVRMALGATARQVLKLFVGRGMALTSTGVLIGLLLALGLTHLLSGMLYEVEATDPATYVVLTVLFLAVCLLGSYIPARRATKVEPTSALRYE